MKLCRACLAGDICLVGLRHPVEPARGIVHWRDRKVTKPGLRNFLKLVASIRLLETGPHTRWMELWYQNSYAYQRAREEYRVILGKHLSRNDRSEALAAMATVHPRPYPQYQWAKEVLR